MCVVRVTGQRGPGIVQDSAWGEKGDLARLCLSVLHVLCILSFVMISTSVEGGMLASRVQQRGGLLGAGVQLSLILQLSVVPVFS